MTSAQEEKHAILMSFVAIPMGRGLNNVEGCRIKLRVGWVQGKNELY